MKEKRTLQHIINTCLKYKLGFEMHNHGLQRFRVYHFKDIEYKFNEEAGEYSQSLSELRLKLDEYIKTL